MKDQPTRSSHPSDVTDQQWDELRIVLPAEKPLGRSRTTNIREVINAMRYRWHTGCVWRKLPEEFPPWATVYTYYRNWQRDGTLAQIQEILEESQPPPVRSSKETNTTEGALKPTDTHAV